MHKIKIKAAAINTSKRISVLFILNINEYIKGITKQQSFEICVIKFKFRIII